VNTTQRLSALLLRSVVGTVLFASAVVAYFPDSTFLTHADSIFTLNADTQMTALRIRKDVHTYFMVTSCKTVNHPFSKVVATVSNTASYPDFFSFIIRTTSIEDVKNDDTVTMFIGAYGIYRIYFFGKIKEEYSADSTRYRISFGDVEQKRFRKAWRRRVRGLVKIGSHDVDIFWTVEKRGEDSCRISLTASQAFTTRTPNWMISTGTNRIFRGMVRDLDGYLKRIAATEKTQEKEEAPVVEPAVDSAPEQTTVPEPDSAAEPVDDTTSDEPATVAPAVEPVPEP
jgi:ribosome-associated toxin RatA of RatAB toxin-antitoxin module